MVDGARRPVAGIAADPRDQLGEIDEFIRLTAQFIRHHRRLGRNRRHDRDPNALALNRFNERAEIAVAGKQDHQVEMGAISMALTASSISILPLTFRRPVEFDKLLRRFGHDRIAIVVEPVDQGADGGIFLIVDQSRVIIGSDKTAFSLKFLQKALVVDVNPSAFALA